MLAVPTFTAPPSHFSYLPLSAVALCEGVTPSASVCVPTHEGATTIVGALLAAASATGGLPRRDVMLPNLTKSLQPVKRA
jgi:hypothetical protein